MEGCLNMPDKANNPTDPYDPHDPWGIRRDLKRNVITEPLYTDITNDPNAIRNIIIDVNLQYYQGREKAFDAVKELAKAALAAKNQAETAEIELPFSVGSSANPYMAAKLRGSVVQEMVRRDVEQAQQQADEA